MFTLKLVRLQYNALYYKLGENEYGKMNIVLSYFIPTDPDFNNFW